ncbi:hypothetical protein [Jiangella anatolica]|uniref:hypothetical protein n=1 Tax=Jiangella anatolica TaxID=2670374 RepID=UPI0011B6BF87|nr:hypothetical protein [Jiangella anatolica]
MTDRDVEIRIEQGTYVDGGTVWNTYIPGHSISFLPVDYLYEGVIPPRGRPVFRSPVGDDGYWFWAELPPGHPGGDTSLRFYYLTATGRPTGSAGSRSRTVRAAGIHGVYAMHGSSGNSIRSNDFQWISGNPMRVRNDSNSNDIRDNEFTRTGQPNGGFYSDWSCDAECAAATTSHESARVTGICSGTTR